HRRHAQILPPRLELLPPLVAGGATVDHRQLASAGGVGDRYTFALRAPQAADVDERLVLRDPMDEPVARIAEFHGGHHEPTSCHVTARTLPAIPRQGGVAARRSTDTLPGRRQADV